MIFGVFTDSVLSVPALLLLIAVITVIGKPTAPFEAVWKMGLTLAIVAVPTMARLARANTMVFAQREFVLAARAMGQQPADHPPCNRPERGAAGAELLVHHHRHAHRGGGLAVVPRHRPEAAEPHLGQHDLRRPCVERVAEYPQIALPGFVMFLTVFSFNKVGEKFRSLGDQRDAKI